MKSHKNARKFSGLLLFLILALNMSAQKLDTLLTDTWTGSVWQRLSKQINTYDGSGFLINSLTQVWNIPTTSWVNSVQIKYKNNPDGTVLRDTSQFWVGTSWINNALTTYTYLGSTKKVLTSTLQTLPGLANSSRQTNTYDGSNFLITTLNETWNGAAWQNSTRTKYTNNLNGTVNTDTLQTWISSAWTNSERSVYTYTGANKISTITTDTLRAGNWANWSLITDTYDGSGFLTNLLEKQWNTGSSTYINNLQANYTNNTDGTPSVVIYQMWNGSTWDNSQRLTFKYSSTTRSPALTVVEGITIFPNPARDAITIKGNNNIHGSTYTITNQAGKLVLKGRLNENSTIDISTLSSGVYFLNLGEKSHQTYKIIKNR